MQATVNILCYKSKVLTNGESPLMIRICKDGNKKYKSLGVSVHPDHWDFQRNRPKKDCPNRELILKIILEKEAGFQKQILELKSEDKEYTASTLIDAKDNQKVRTVSEFYKSLIQEFQSEGRIGNSRAYLDSHNSLKRFTGKKLDIPFSHIDVSFLKEYEKWLRKCGCAETSMSVMFRTLRSAYNKAIDAKCAKRAAYPFNDYKVSKFNIKTKKRAIPKQVIKSIMNLDLSKESDYLQFSRDLFIFSYLCGGMNFTDMANLKYSNINDDKLVYIRQKTGKEVVIPLNSDAYVLIVKYWSTNHSALYIFPILNEKIHISEVQKYNRKKKVLLTVNDCLKTISEKIGTKVNLTTYVARHSFATVLKNSGVNIALISETLGHSDIATTQIYLDSFESEQIGEALKHLL